MLTLMAVVVIGSFDVVDSLVYMMAYLVQEWREFFRKIESNVFSVVGVVQVIGAVQS